MFVSHSARFVTAASTTPFALSLSKGLPSLLERERREGFDRLSSNGDWIKPSWKASHGRDEGGFTLIEMLVALAIFSLAALALLRLQGGTLRSTAQLQGGIVAGIVARNIVVEALTDPAPPALGRSSGAETNAGFRWNWTRTVGRTGEARLQQITVTVTDEAGRQAATLTAFRSVG